MTGGTASGQGTGVDDRGKQDPAERKCRPYACAIQTCLKFKNFQQAKCTAEIERWERCVREVKAEIAAAKAAEAATLPAEG
jgi:hypothetical protein